MKYTHEELALLNQYMYIEGAEEQKPLKDNIINMKRKLKDPNSKIRLGAELSRKEALDTLERIEKNPKLMHLKIMESYNNNNLGVILQDTSKDNINKESLLVSRGTGGDNDIWRDSFKGIIGELTPESLKYLNWTKAKDNEYNITYATGHSNGGCQTQIFAVEAGKNLKEAISFDGQGIPDDYVKRHEKEIMEKKDKITSISAEFDFVNILLQSVAGKRIYLETDKTGENPHKSTLLTYESMFDENGNYKQEKIVNQHPIMKELSILVNSTKNLSRKDREELAIAAGNIASPFLGTERNNPTDPYNFVEKYEVLQQNIKDIKREFGETKEGFINTLESYSKTIVNPFNLQNNKDYFKNVGETIQNTEELGINLYKGVGSGLKFTGDIAKSAKDFYTLGEKLYKLSENPDVKESMDKIVDMTIPTIKEIAYKNAMTREVYKYVDSIKDLPEADRIKLEKISHNLLDSVFTDGKNSENYNFVRDINNLNESYDKIKQNANNLNKNFDEIGDNISNIVTLDKPLEELDRLKENSYEAINSMKGLAKGLGEKFKDNVKFGTDCIKALSDMDEAISTINKNPQARESMQNIRNQIVDIINEDHKIVGTALKVGFFVEDKSISQIIDKSIEKTILIGEKTGNIIGEKAKEAKEKIEKGLTEVKDNLVNEGEKVKEILVSKKKELEELSNKIGSKTKDYYEKGEKFAEKLLHNDEVEKFQEKLKEKHFIGLNLKDDLLTLKNNPNLSNIKKECEDKIQHIEKIIIKNKERIENNVKEYGKTMSKTYDKGISYLTEKIQHVEKKLDFKKDEGIESNIKSLGLKAINRLKEETENKANKLDTDYKKIIDTHKFIEIEKNKQIIKETTKKIEEVSQKILETGQKIVNNSKYLSVVKEKFNVIEKNKEIMKKYESKTILKPIYYKVNKEKIENYKEAKNFLTKQKINDVKTLEKKVEKTNSNLQVKRNELIKKNEELKKITTNSLTNLKKLEKPLELAKYAMNPMKIVELAQRK